MLDLAGEGFVDCSAIMSCAVYALVRKGEVVYVGKSKTAYARIGTHCRTRTAKEAKLTGLFEHKMLTGIRFDTIWVRRCMLRELDEVEIAMIKKYLPKYNVKHKPISPPDISLDTLIAELVPCLPPAPEPRASWRRW